MVISINRSEPGYFTVHVEVSLTFSSLSGTISGLSDASVVSGVGQLQVYLFFGTFLVSLCGFFKVSFDS